MGAFPGAQLTKARPAFVLSTEDYHRYRPDVVVGLITTQVPEALGSDGLRIAGLEAGGPTCGVLFQAVSGHVTKACSLSVKLASLCVGKVVM